MATVTEARERPIIFSGSMVKAILEGRKTQTRRVIKPQPEEWTCDVPGCEDIGGLGWKGRFFETDAQPGNPPNHAERLEDCCPYGKPGDRLWVRETWATKEYREYDPSGAYSIGTGEQQIFYRAGGEGGYGEPDYGWKSPIHMPRWASRITLEITDVRVQRIQDISEADAEAEGVPICDYSFGKAFGGSMTGDGVTRVPVDCARTAFADMWNEINRKRGFGWDVNPWVWAITSERVGIKS